MGITRLTVDPLNEFRVNNLFPQNPRPGNGTFYGAGKGGRLPCRNGFPLAVIRALHLRKDHILRVDHPAQGRGLDRLSRGHRDLRNSAHCVSGDLQLTHKPGPRPGQGERLPLTRQDHLKLF